MHLGTPDLIVALNGPLTTPDSDHWILEALNDPQVTQDNPHQKLKMCLENMSLPIF